MKISFSLRVPSRSVFYHYEHPNNASTAGLIPLCDRRYELAYPLLAGCELIIAPAVDR